MSQSLTIEHDGGSRAINIGGSILLIAATLISTFYLWATTHGEYGRVGFPSATIAEFVSHAMIPNDLVKPFDGFSYSSAPDKDSTGGGMAANSSNITKPVSGVIIDGTVIMQFSSIDGAHVAVSEPSIASWNDKIGKSSGVTLGNCADRAFFVVCRTNSAPKAPVDYYNAFMQW